MCTARYWLEEFVVRARTAGTGRQEIHLHLQSLPFDQQDLAVARTLQAAGDVVQQTAQVPGQRAQQLHDLLPVHLGTDAQPLADAAAGRIQLADALPASGGDGKGSFQTRGQGPPMPVHGQKTIGQQRRIRLDFRPSQQAVRHGFDGDRIAQQRTQLGTYSHFLTQGGDEFAGLHREFFQGDPGLARAWIGGGPGTGRSPGGG